MSENPSGAGKAMVKATGLSLSYRKQPVFAGLDLDVPGGTMLVVRGQAGAGKTALLLTLAGRMRFDAGTLTVAGHQLPKRASAVRHRVALATIAGVNELDDALTVEQHIAERLVIHQPWWKPFVRPRTVQQVIDRVDAVIAEVAGRAIVAGTSGGQPAFGRLRRHEFISDVPPLERMVLGVILALLGRPQMLVVDDVDALRDGDDRRRAWAALLALLDHAGQQLTVVASCHDATDLYALPSDHPVQVIDLPAPAGRVAAQDDTPRGLAETTATSKTLVEGA